MPTVRSRLVRSLAHEKESGTGRRRSSTARI